MREARADKVIADWKARQRRGEVIDPEDVVRAHPELSVELRKRFAHLASGRNPPSSTAELLARLSRREPPRYAHHDEIARGGMGAILRVRDEALDRDLAMKVVLEARGGSDGSSPHVHRFVEEARVTAQLDHPGVVPVHELGVAEDGQVYFTMKLVKGRTLGDVFELVREDREDWNPTRALQVFVRICETLAFAHSKGVVHRDLKPANIMVGDFGEVYVMDWGLAKVLGEHAEPVAEPDAQRTLLLSSRAAAGDTPDSPAMTLEGDILGTPAYMPLEQAMGRRPDARSDVYAIGAMLYELFARHAPYGEPEHKRAAGDVLVALMAGPPAPIQALAPKLPVEIVAITEKAMARDPADRYQSAGELGQDLRHFIEGRVVRAYRTGALVELGKWVQRNRLFAGAAGVALLLLVTGLLVTRVLYTEAQGRTAERDRALRTTRALALARASSVAMPTAPMRALLLAREAGRSSMLPEVVGQLHDAIRRSHVRGILKGHRHECPITHVAFSPAGDRILTASADATARLWDLEGNQIVVFRGHQDRIDSAVFSPAGDRVLTASLDGTARVWDLEGNEIAVLRGQRGLRSAVFSPAGDRILTTAEGRRTAVLFDLQGNEVAVFRGHEDSVNSAAYSPAGDRVLTASADQTVRIWDLGGKEIACLQAPEPVRSASFSPAGDRILVRESYVARVLDLRGTELARCKPNDGGVIQSAAFTPAGDRFLTTAYATVRFWDLEGNDVAAFQAESWGVSSAAVSPAGDQMVTGSQDGIARVWDLEESAIPLLRGHESEVLSAAFSPGNDQLVTASRDQTVRVWDLAGHQLAICRGHEGAVNSVVFSPAGDRILSASDDETARLWDLDGHELRAYPGHARVWSAAFSLRGDRIAMACGDHRVRVCDLEGHALAELDGHRGQVLTAVFNAAGDRILTASMDRTARLWDLAGNQIAVLRGHEGFVYSACFSPAEDRILTTSQDRTARVWRLDGTGLAVLRGHEALVWRGAFSPAGNRIATASWDHTARLWDLEGHELAILSGHEGNIYTVAFDSTGDRLVTASKDGTAGIWITNPEKLLRLADQRVTRDFTPEERGRYAALLARD